jgi:LacI family transcriptional regulator
VSVGTVSNALNRPELVHESTRKRIDRAIAELGFTKHSGAALLAGGRSTTIGLLVGGPISEMAAAIAHGVQAVIGRFGFRLHIAVAEGSADVLARHIEGFMEDRVAGLILCPDASSAEAIERAELAGFPLAVVSPEPKPRDPRWILLERPGPASAEDAGRRAAMTLLPDSSP